MNKLPLQKGAPLAPTKTLRLGVIGLGWVAKHCHLPSLAMLRSEGWPIEVGALCDINGKSLQSAAADWPSAALDDDPGALLNRAGLNGVLILTHPDSSARLLQLAIERGLTTFVEKPVGRAAGEINRCAELAAARKVRVQVGYNRRYQPLAAEYARLIRELGPCRHLAAHFWRASRTESGFYDDTLVHCLDFISHQLGHLEVRAVRVWPPEIKGNGLAAGWRIDLASTGNCGVTAEIDIRPAVGRDLERYAVLGPSRSIELEYPHVAAIDGRAELVVYDKGSERVVYRASMTSSDGEPRFRHSGFLAQMAEFCQLCDGRLTEPTCGLDAAAEALRLRDEIMKMMERGTPLAAN